MTSTLRRAYKTASADGCGVMLDGAPLRTPAGHPCTLPTPALAQAVAAEWQMQGKDGGEQVKPATMPLTQLAMTAIDRILPNRALIEEDVLRYLTTELICHYAGAAPVAAFQRARWQPFHDWLQQKFAVVLPVTASITPLPESDTAWAALHVAGYNEWRLCALQQAVSLTSSFVIGLALVEGAASAAAALDAAEAEADFQAQEWGADADIQARRASVLAELEAVATFITKIN